MMCWFVVQGDETIDDAEHSIWYISAENHDGHVIGIFWFDSGQ